MCRLPAAPPHPRSLPLVRATSGCRPRSPPIPAISPVALLAVLRVLRRRVRGRRAVLRARAAAASSPPPSRPSRPAVFLLRRYPAPQVLSSVHNGRSPPRRRGTSPPPSPSCGTPASDPTLRPLDLRSPLPSWSHGQILFPRLVHGDRPPIPFALGDDRHGRPAASALPLLRHPSVMTTPAPRRQAALLTRHRSPAARRPPNGHPCVELTSAAVPRPAAGEKGGQIPVASRCRALAICRAIATGSSKRGVEVSSSQYLKFIFGDKSIIHYKESVIHYKESVIHYKKSVIHYQESVIHYKKSVI